MLRAEWAAHPRSRGVGTKGNTILQRRGIDSRLVDVAAERTPAKLGARTLGSEISDRERESSARAKPDHYLGPAWHFRDEFVEREAVLPASRRRHDLPAKLTIEIVWLHESDDGIASCEQGLSRRHRPIGFHFLEASRGRGVEATGFPRARAPGHAFDVADREACPPSSPARVPTKNNQLAAASTTRHEALHENHAAIFDVAASSPPRRQARIAPAARAHRWLRCSVRQRWAASSTVTRLSRPAAPTPPRAFSRRTPLATSARSAPPRSRRLPAPP